ncbi:TonB-dependent receptor [Sphingomonas bacterium]|uniref:TonB-dependent receptor domain-containing protein n=1 Tax=Sphingomonas bacterium TaxID=1895847 RepID=UPI0026044681|nr:TonB-dependent receptor [Sphingomonas bacterium]MDB5679735.1 TonB-dependent receptor [Sphingomonas bacterium]
MKISRFLSATALVSCGLLAPQFAYAADKAADKPAVTAEAVPADAPQTTPAAGDQANADTDILITGSRIRRPQEESNVPVTSLSGAELTQNGDISIGDALNDLPSLRSTFSQANSTRFIGTTGLNELDLRGLGTTRTLVLVNGRRHITAQPGDFIIDTNTIPTDLIERVDIITGGSSAVYGSDAVAGVVNFILKDKYQGITLKGQSGVSSRGDRPIRFVSLTAGQNFADGRGNVALNLEYTTGDALYLRDRNDLTGAFTGRCQLNLNENTAGEPQSGNGVPDNVFFCGVRNGTISNGGTVLAANPIILVGGVNTAVACTNTTLAPAGVNAALGLARCLNAGTAQGVQRIFRFDANSNLVQDIPAYDFRPVGSGNIIDAPNAAVPGSTLRDTGQLAPGLKRFTANVLAHFEISPAFVPFFEGKYVRLRALQEGQPSFFSSVSSTIGAPNPRCDNAYLTGSNLAALQNIGVCTNVATGTFALNRFNVDFGGRQERIKRDTWRIVGGVKGTFNTDWNYEISATYGEVKIHQDELNDLKLTDLAGNFDGFLLAYDAVRNGAGQIVCRVNQVTVTRPDCVPINLLGNGAPSQAALNFVNTTSYLDQKASELDVLAYIGGDSSQLFSLPGGPVRFVVGSEYRRETASSLADPLSSAGGTFFNAFKPFNPQAFEVKEAFGELEIPLLRDLPFFKELTVTGAARYSDYNTSAGHTFAWNVGSTWAPVRDIRFRANYSKSVRVPTLSDLFSPASQNFAFIADPCDVANIGNGTTSRPTNCAAAGVPVGFVNTPARTASTGFLSSGNKFLTPETSKSLTIGGVLTPRFIPGFSFSADYYRIRVNNLIAVLSAQTILNQCYDLPSLSNQYCALLNPRNADSTFKNPALTSAGVNFAQFKADGIDFELDYTHKFGGFRLDVRALATYVIRRDNFTSPTNPTFRDRIKSELGDPALAANLNIGLGAGPFTFHWSVNYLGKQTIGAYENYFAVDGRPPQNADNTAQVWYPAIFYHAFKLDIDVSKKFNFYVGVDNAFDTMPPLGLVGNEGGVPYENIGRYFYAGAKVNF